MHAYMTTYMVCNIPFHIIFVLYIALCFICFCLYAYLFIFCIPAAPFAVNVNIVDIRIP